MAAQLLCNLIIFLFSINIHQKVYFITCLCKGSKIELNDCLMPFFILLLVNIQHNGYYRKYRIFSMFLVSVFIYNMIYGFKTSLYLDIYL